MKVIVQQIGKQLYLRISGDWTPAVRDATAFTNPVEALGFCLRKNLRDVCLVSNFDQLGTERRVYPFGGDPATKLELKRLRRSVKEARRLKTHRQIVRARMDILLAEGKEKKKQHPFKRKAIGEREERPNDTDHRGDQTA